MRLCDIFLILPLTQILLSESCIFIRGGEAPSDKDWIIVDGSV